MLSTDAPSLDASLSVLVVDDHPALREGIATLIARVPGLRVRAEAASASAALDAMRLVDPNLAIVEINLPGADGLELTRAMLAERPWLRVIIYSRYVDPMYAVLAIQAGARGYVMKSEPAEVLLAAIQTAANGALYVSPRLSTQLIFQVLQRQEAGEPSPLDRLSGRQMEVLDQLGRGKSTRQTAVALGMHLKTVETHRAALKKRLGLSNAHKLVRFACEWVEINRKPLPGQAMPDHLLPNAPDHDNPG